MNILEAEDIIKGLPDQSLMQEAQAPSGQVPQFLVVSEIQRRTDMRKRYEEQQPNQGTVKDQILQQGIMSAMPPQMPAGMPPQMPAGMPPQGMPPQQMFSGGIIRLEKGGSTSPYERAKEASAPYKIQAGDTPSKVARMFGVSVDELLAHNEPLLGGRFDVGTVIRNPREKEMKVKAAYQQGVPVEQIARAMRMDPTKVLSLLSGRQQASASQYNPLLDEGVSDLDKAFIASDRAKDIVADQVGSRFNYFQPPEIVGDVVEGAVNAYRSIPSMEDLVSSARDALPAPPSRESVESAGRQAGEGLVGLMRGMLPEAPERGQTPDLAGRYAEQLASISLPDLGGPTREEALAADRRRVASIREGIAPLSEEISPFGTYGSTPEEFAAKRGQYSLPEGAGSNFPEVFQSGRDVNTQLASLPEWASSVFDATNDSSLDPTKSDIPELSEAIVAAQRLTTDASKKPDGVGLLYDDDGFLGMLSGTGSKEVQGTSGIQAQGTPDKTEPSLDFADLIAESKKAGMANALMQLGAGIAGGDLSKGISAAGIAATKGQQDAKAIAIRKRLAEYQAGREDMARDEQKRQFGLELDLKQDQYGKSLLQTSLSSIPDMIRQRELELTSLRTTLSDDDPRITAIVEEIKNLTNQYNTFIKRAEGEISDFSGYRVVGTTGA